MFFVLSKLLYYIAMPLIWILSFLLYSFFTKNERRRKRSILAALLLILFFGNEFLVNELFSVWEKRPVPIVSLPVYDYAIVLTGVTITERESVSDRVYFSKGADRLLHTVQLYKLGKIRKIIVTGGSAGIIHKTVAEARQLKKVFFYCGIPEEDLIIEDQARNTHENALFTKKLTDSLHLRGKFLLITSAFHMKRSQCCFDKAGLKCDLFPVDIYAHDRTFAFNYLFIPSESAFNKWSVLIHEVIGYIVYHMMGYC